MNIHTVDQHQNDRASTKEIGDEAEVQMDKDSPHRDLENAGRRDTNAQVPQKEGRQT